MVNTFLVDRDFVASARKLDSPRLGKQRVEAKQILTILENLRILSQLLRLPDFPKEDSSQTKQQRDAWISFILTNFKATGMKAIHVYSDFSVITPYYSKDAFPIRPDFNETLEIDDKGIVHHYRVLKKSRKLLNSGMRQSFVFPDDRFITDGFNYHPAVSMWLGYEEMLKLYINAHIQVWKERGFVNTMKNYDVASCNNFPPWFNNDIIVNFKSTLIEREIERDEPGWYIYQYDFICAWITDIEKRNQFCTLINYCITNKVDWKQVYKKEQLLTFGKFPGFIWP